MKSTSSTPTSSFLLDWSHQERGTWWRLAVFILLATGAGAAAFYLFRVPPPEPTRGMPSPTSVTLLPPTALGTDVPGAPLLPGLETPLPQEGLDLPQGAEAEPYAPSYQGYTPAYEPQPDRPHPSAWPDFLHITQPVLPPP